MKVLIVDDEITSRLILKKHLSAFGEVTACSSGTEAIEAFKAALAQGSAFELVCMDVLMPGMDGFEAVIRIREIEEKSGIQGDRRTKILMATGLEEDDGSLESIEGAYDGVLRKPVRSDPLKEMLSRLQLG